jgi:hypothetical protein
VNTWINVARYHLAQRGNYLALPWTWLAFGFCVDLVIFALIPLALLFIYGMWTGVVYRRWNLPGTMTFVAGQITVLVVAALLVTWGHAWAGTGRFFSALPAAGLTGVFAALAVALLAGGYLTVRRAAI